MLSGMLYSWVAKCAAAMLQSSSGNHVATSRHNPYNVDKEFECVAHPQQAAKHPPNMQHAVEQLT